MFIKSHWEVAYNNLPPLSPLFFSPSLKLSLHKFHALLLFTIVGMFSHTSTHTFLL